MRQYLFVGLCILLAPPLYAQTPYDSSIKASPEAHELPINRGSTALWQSLKKLHTRASLIMVTAHPDDEDGGMLAYESRGRGTRVALLTLNRGEGGANVMSNDFFDALGLVRTMELLNAGRYYGVDQYWTRVIDYGFSKTKAESISHWTHDRVRAGRASRRRGRCGRGERDDSAGDVRSDAGRVIRADLARGAGISEVAERR